MKLLLADDEPDVQLIARLALKRAKFQVVTVNNGIEVLEAVAADQPEGVGRRAGLRDLVREVEHHGGGAEHPEHLCHAVRQFGLVVRRGEPETFPLAHPEGEHAEGTHDQTHESGQRSGPRRVHSPQGMAVRD